MSLSTENLTGYDTHDRYFASRFSQGERKVYSFDLSLSQVVATLPKPDPDNPTPGNRMIIPKHAREFAAYIREKRDWVAPALLLRAPDNIFEFEPQADIGGCQFGIVAVPRLARQDLRILDGQHRILGIHLAFEANAAELAEARSGLSAAKSNGSDPSVVAVLEQKVKRLERERDRFGAERISVQVALEDEEKGYKQMFVDIAENAKGITKTIQTRFDTRKIVNRVLVEVIKHPLLDSRIEDQLDRVKSDRDLLAAKHVTEIVRAVAVGLDGRISRRQEDEMKEEELIDRATRFMNILTQAFPDLAAVAADEKQPGELRGKSLLGSATMLRVLAGVYHNLAEPGPQKGQSIPDAMSDDEVAQYFSILNSHMAVPVTESLWLDTGVFDVGASAPRARGGDIRRLADQIAGWARTGLPEDVPLVLDGQHRRAALELVETPV